MPRKNEKSPRCNSNPPDGSKWISQGTTINDPVFHLNWSQNCAEKSSYLKMQCLFNIKLHLTILWTVEAHLEEKMASKSLYNPLDLALKSADHVVIDELPLLLPPQNPLLFWLLEGSVGGSSSLLKLAFAISRSCFSHMAYLLYHSFCFDHQKKQPL